MHTPQKDVPQSARRSSRHHRLRNNSDVQRNVQSDNDAYQAVAQEGDQTPSRKNRQPRKKSNAKRNGVQSDVGEAGETMIPRPASHGERPKFTPAKNIKSDAYAGATFQQSPAASALPIPSFYSRSMPNNATISTIAETTDDSAELKDEDDKQPVAKKELTAIEKMLKAAEDARISQNTPNGASPARFLSPPSGSPASRSPGPRDGEAADFPFELEDSPSIYSTPLTQRFAAERSPESTSQGGPTMSEAERRAKTAALKQALMKTPGSEDLGPAFNDANPFNARNIQPRPDFTPRHTSNPVTPTYQNGYASGYNQYSPYQPHSPSRNASAQTNSRPTSSSLRNIYDPNNAPLSPPQTDTTQRISTTRPTPPLARTHNFGAIYGQTSRPASEGISGAYHNSKPSLEKGLDDLRKALNVGGFFPQTQAQ
ncbi:hypothetical protein H2198_010072 [Neophaeococcomyces mojaviensis]|uniref:Uncharacterized protein n=1 Tax=Neophaeococcomyces mojaviensis TaxID=3383035 RepID=A0ACC2ZSN5_9EURO|nr:hypothetical protein H2198_010072 [Knufia sp. JES_112]